jgi:hypothetical protein
MPLKEFFLLSFLRLQRRRHESLGGDTTDDYTQGIDHVSQVFLVFGSGLLAVGGRGLMDCDPRQVRLLVNSHRGLVDCDLR